jgi:protein-L-isoaspartate(D-aspartate) O-methyltransferase
LDVHEEGLCQECRDKQEKRETKKGLRVSIVLPLLFGAIAVFIAAFYLGRFAGQRTSPLSEGQQEAAVDDDPSAEEEASPGGAAGTEPEPLGEEPPVFDIRTMPEGPPTDGRSEYVKWMLANTDQEEEFLLAKWSRAQWALNWSAFPDFTHETVLQGFLRTPREYFCRPQNIDRAYAHAYLPIGYGQTISGPHIVARMTDALDPQPDHRVLEIGTGSGYQSAFLSELSNYVYTIEIIEPLAMETDEIYRELEAAYPQYGNIKRKVDDGYFGWEDYAPFDRIIVTAGIDHIPPPLLQQLAPDGIMVIPVGPPSGQKILKITKRIEDDLTVSLEREDIYEGTKIDTDIFVPFTAKDGGVHSKQRDVE